MRPITSTPRWFAAAVCLLASSSFTVAEEGVVRISDAATRPGVVKMNAVQQRPVQQTAYGRTGNQMTAGPQNSAPGHATMAASVGPAQNQNTYRPTNPYQQAGYATVGNHSLVSAQACCNSGYCGPECCDASCCPPCYGECEQGSYCGSCDSRGGRRKGGKGGWDSRNSHNDYSYGKGYRRRMWTVFAKATPKSRDPRIWPKRWWRGQQLGYLARNQRLSNTLFGWLVPSGCNGQGCPPVGKYHVTYAHDPGYADARDGHAYGAQGYGVPVTVPLAPNVRHAYNYSWGTPSSRITPMGHYSPGISTPQSLYHQSW